MSGLSPSCRESRAAAAVGPADGRAARRIELHRAGCADCAAYLARLAHVRVVIVDAAGPRLDDLQRARLDARVARALDEAERAPAPRRLSAHPSLWVAAFALGIAAGLLLFVRPRPAPTVAAPTAPPLLAPYVIAGDAARVGDAARALAEPVDRLDVPAGGVVRARVGDGARVTLFGPATLTARPAARDRIELDLGSGLLVGEYAHGQGGTLRIHSPGAVTTIVGTVFAVDAGDGAASRVAVGRGLVEVRAGARSARVAAGWSYRVGEAAPEPIPAVLAALLADEAAALPPPRAPAGTLTLSGTPARAEVSLGGVPLGPTPLVARLPAGAVGLSVRAPRHAVVTLPATIPGAGVVDLRYALAPERDPRALRAVADKPRPRPALKSVAGAEPGPTQTAPPPLAPRSPSAPRSLPSQPLPRVESADDVYASAETAMRAGDGVTARARLAEVVRRFPTHPLADAALYELARLATVEAPARARAYLDELLARGNDPTLREPARFLCCRLDFDAHRQAAAASCLATFRRDYPSSSHDAEALALLIGLLQVGHDCRGARARIDEYLRLYPTGPFAAEAAERRARCAP